MNGSIKMCNGKKITLIKSLLLFSICLSGCVFVGPFNQSQKFTKIVHMPVSPLSAGSGFKTATHNGSIEVRGSNVTDCNIIATITGHASSVEKAEEIVEQTKLSFDQSGSTLILKIDKPDNMVNRSVSVGLDIILPDKIDLDLASHNGKISIENVTGKTNITSHNGAVIVSSVSGVTRLETHNGEIAAREISGDIDFLSHNGMVKADFAQAAAPDCDITMVTHNGGIDLTTPRNYSAKVDVVTRNGHIDTDLPITISGKFTGKNLNGTIRDGQGNLKLETYNGSIKIR
jgi:hypothetical protein